MNIQKIQQYKTDFDLIVKTVTDDDGQEIEVWYARELQQVLGYSRWENFVTAIGRAMQSCKTLGVSIDWQLYIVVAVSVLLVWGTYAFINYHAKRHTNFLHWLVNTSIRTHLGRTDWWKRFTAWLDHPEEKLVKRLEQEKKSEKAVPINDTPVDPEDLKEQDRKKILDFMKGRAEVMVYDIIKHSGAERLRVYPILFEEEMKGRVRVIKTHGMGAPEIVALNY